MRKTISYFVTFLLVATGLSVTAVAQKTVTIQVPIGGPELEAIVTFDPSKVSASDVRRWMKLAENGYYQTPVGMPFDCAKGPDLEKRQRGVDDNQKLVDELQTSSYPLELSGVVLYLKHLQSFWLWQQEQELHFFRDGDMPDLEWEGVDAQEKCGGTIARLRNDTDADNVCMLVAYHWQNCVLQAARSDLGTYPRDDWKTFLQVYGITVKLISTNNLWDGVADDNDDDSL